MTEDERNGLLMEIKVKLDNLITAFDRVSNGTGFPRCVERIQRIQRLEQDVIIMKPIVATMEVISQRIASLEKTDEKSAEKKADFDKWLMRITWAVIIVGIVKAAFF